MAIAGPCSNSPVAASFQADARSAASGVEDDSTAALSPMKAYAYLRLRNIGPEPEPADSLYQALIRVFRESFPLARDLPEQSSQSLDALVK
jgi:hypothetical protein